MTKKSEQKAFPLWAKIVIGIFGVGLVSTVMLIALNVVTYQAFTTPSVTEQKLENSDLSSNEPLSMNAEAAIKDYLAQANQDIKEDQIVASGD